MKRLLLLLVTATALTARSAELPFQKMSVGPAAVPAPSFDTTGGFLAVTSDALLAADREGAIWTTPLKEGKQWTATDLKVPQFAAAARWGDVWIVTGGLTGGQPTNTVSVLESLGGKPTLRPLPALPVPLAGAGAAVIADKLYILGGASSVSPPVPTKSFWVLDLKKPDTWQKGPDFPGEARAFPGATEQYGMLCAFGGIAPGLRLLQDTWVFRPGPLEGTRESGWKRLADVPEPVARAVAVPIGQSQVMIVGGERGEPPAGLLEPSPGKQDGGRPLLFHTLTDAWCAFDAHPGITFPATARADGKFLMLGNTPDGKNAPLELEVVRNVRNLNWVDYTVIVFYFAFISLIGILASRHQKSSADFSLAGRNVPWWVAGISMFATGASAISFMAIPALAFATNLVFLFPTTILIVSYFVQSRAIYPLLRKMEITSTYEYLERRFNKTLRLIASAQCIAFQTFGRASVVLVLPSLAISATTGISVYVSVTLMWFITTIYTAAGGFHAVVWTDVFQGILKFFAPLAMIGVCIFSLPGGTREFVDLGLSHHKFDFALMTWDITVPAVWILVLAAFLNSTIVQAGDQPVIQRVFSSPEKEVRRVAMMSTFCGILISVVVNVLGVAIYAYFHANPGKLDPLAQNDKIVPLFVIQALPHGFIGVVIAAIFASAMTTVASSMNSSATVFTEDFFMRFKPDATDKLRVKVLRISSTVVGVVALSVALMLATLNLKSLMVTWTIISSLLGGGIVGVYTLGMFTKRANGFGAICGAVISIVLTAVVKFYTPIHWSALIPIAIFSCIISGYLLSFLSSHHKDLAGLTVFTPVQGKQ